VYHVGGKPPIALFFEAMMLTSRPLSRCTSKFCVDGVISCAFSIEYKNHRLIKNTEFKRRESLEGR